MLRDVDVTLSPEVESRMIKKGLSEATAEEIKHSNYACGKIIYYMPLVSLHQIQQTLLLKCN